MKTSKFFNNTKVKTISAILLFLIFVTVFTIILYRPFGKVYSNENNYDMAFIGASQIRAGIDTRQIDKLLGTNSCDYSVAGCMSEGKYSMAKAALEMSNLKTIVFDMSYFSITKTYDEYIFDEKLLYFPLISGINNKFDTAMRDFSFWDDEYDQLYAVLIHEGTDAWKKVISGKYDTYLERKGYAPQKVVNVQIKDKRDILKYHDSVQLKADFPSYNLEVLGKAVDMCREKGVRVVVITMPVSQKFLWIGKGWDAYQEAMCDFAKEHDIEYYNFNLMKGYSDHFTDTESFLDVEHMSKKGAKEFTKILAKVLKTSGNSNKSGIKFYDTYAEAKQHLEYYEILNQS